MAGFQEATGPDAGWMKDKPTHVSWTFELTIDRAEVEAAWCRRTADRIEAGEGVHTGESDSIQT